MSDFRELLAWREAMVLVESIYRDTASFPRDEAFCLRLQLRRSAISVPSNLAEGAGRHSTGELRQYVGIASGFLAELETQLQLSVRLGLLSPEAPSLALAALVGKLVRSLRRSLRSTN